MAKFGALVRHVTKISLNHPTIVSLYKSFLSTGPGFDIPGFVILGFVGSPFFITAPSPRHPK